MRTVLWQPLGGRALRSVAAVCALLAGSALAAVAPGAAQAASGPVCAWMPARLGGPGRV
jgi:hypothetical protein